MNKFALLFLLVLSTPLFCNFPIECTGRTDITYVGQGVEDWKRVTSYNPVEIDFRERQIRSLEEAENNTPIQFTDPQRRVFAKNLVIDFVSKKGSFELCKLTLTGQVRLMSQEVLDDQSTHLQYALADRLIYTHGIEEILLSSKPESRVLYFDELHQTQMSAPKITIKKNPETGKPKIEGEGAVKFIFKEEELRKLKGQL